MTEKIMTASPPDGQELWDAHCGDHDNIITVHREADDSWRHGSYVYEVFHRISDDTHWATNYNEQSDGEYVGLREEDYSIDQVEPHAKMIEVIEWRTLS